MRDLENRKGEIERKKALKGIKSSFKKGKRYMQDFWRNEDGMGVVEVVLIIIVLVGLVILFKKQITSLVNTILSKMTSQAKQI